MAAGQAVRPGVRTRTSRVIVEGPSHQVTRTFHDHAAIPGYPGIAPAAGSGSGQAGGSGEPSSAS